MVRDLNKKFFLTETITYGLSDEEKSEYNTTL